MIGGTVVKRIISAVLLSALLAAALAFWSYALPLERAKVSQNLDILKENYWTEGEGVTGISRRIASGEETIYAGCNEPADSVSFSAAFDPMDLSAFTELMMYISVKGKAETYNAFVYLYGDESSSSHTFQITSDSSEIYIPLREDIAKAFKGIKITAAAENAKISYVTVSSVQVDDSYTYSYLERFSSKDIDSEYRLERSPEKITVYPEDKSASVSPLYNNVYERGRDVLVWIEFEHSIGGSVFVDVLYGEEESYKSLPLTADMAGAYTFIVEGGFEKATFSFSTLSSDQPLNITGAGIADMGETVKSAGSLTSCSYDGKKITVKGSLSLDASLKYIDSKLLLYKIPVKDVLSYDLESLEPCATGGFSTKFTLTAPGDAGYLEYFYKVVLDTSDGFLPVGNITAADCGAVSSVSSRTGCAIYGAEAADTFEMNASSVILDVYAGKLLEVEDIYSAQMYNHKTPYYFNRDYLAEIDSNIRFFRSADIDVYLRIYSDKEGYVFDYNVQNAENLSLMCAVCSFLSQRYSDVSGYIMGKAVNSQKSITPKTQEENARLIAVFAEAVKSQNQSALVIVPFSEKESGDKWIASSMLHYYLAKYSSPSVLSMYECAEKTTNASNISYRLSILAAQFGSSTDGSAVMWTVPSSKDKEYITEEFRSLCVGAASYGCRFAAIDLSKTQKDPGLYDSLKSMLDSENVVSAEIVQFAATTENKAFLGEYPLWDFTDSYDTAGWVSGPFTPGLALVM